MCSPYDPKMFCCVSHTEAPRASLSSLPSLDRSDLLQLVNTPHFFTYSRPKHADDLSQVARLAIAAMNSLVATPSTFPHQLFDNTRLSPTRPGT